MALLTGLVAAVAVAPQPASAELSGLYYRSCDIPASGWKAELGMKLEWNDNNLNQFRIYSLSWNTYPRFTPSRLVVSTLQNDDSRPIIRAWGGSADTLHDVEGCGDTGINWERTWHNAGPALAVVVRFHLNDNPRGHCEVKILTPRD